MGILKVAITILAVVVASYLLFIMPKRVRNSRSARMRYYIFFFVAAIFIFVVVKIFR